MNGSSKMRALILLLAVFIVGMTHVEPIHRAIHSAALASADGVYSFVVVHANFLLVVLAIVHIVVIILKRNGPRTYNNGPVD